MEEGNSHRFEPIQKKKNFSRKAITSKSRKRLNKIGGKYLSISRKNNIVNKGAIKNPGRMTKTNKMYQCNECKKHKTLHFRVGNYIRSIEAK